MRYARAPLTTAPLAPLWGSSATPARQERGHPPSRPQPSPPCHRPAAAALGGPRAPAPTAPTVWEPAAAARPLTANLDSGRGAPHTPCAVCQGPTGKGPRTAAPR